MREDQAGLEGNELFTPFASVHDQIMTPCCVTVVIITPAEVVTCFSNLDDV